jgi:hypothetical protein
MIIRLCRLCHQERPLVWSHVIPEFMHAPLYDAGRRMLCLGEEHGRPRRRLVQKGDQERLLCQECDRDLINRRYEQPNTAFWRALAEGGRPCRGVTMTAVSGQPATMVRGFDYASFKLLLLSVFWRASVASATKYPINLQEHGERIRKMLLARNPGPETAYPCLLYRLVGLPSPGGIITRPIEMSLDGWPAYQMVLTGVSVCLVVSTKTGGYTLAPHVDGSMCVGLVDWHDDLLVTQAGEMLRIERKLRAQHVNSPKSAGVG